MYSLFVGIDVSKGWFDVSIAQDHNPKYLGQFDNSIEGFQDMINTINDGFELTTSDILFCFENTGTYSKLLLNWLISQMYPCVEEVPLRIKKSMGLTRGKSDRIDSRTICLYAYRHKESLQLSTLDSPEIQTLKKLISRRDFLVKQRANLLKSLKEQKNEIAPDLFDQLNSQNDLLIDQYSTLINWVEEKIKQLIKSDRSLSKNNRIVQSVPGIGKITAWTILAVTHNFTKFNNSRQFACYCGIAPFPNSSGKSFQGNNRISYIGHKMLKSLLSNGANSAIRHNQQMAAYAKRKEENGKHKGIIINNVKNKIIHAVFACVKRQSEYIKLSYA